MRIRDANILIKIFLLMVITAILFSFNENRDNLTEREVLRIHQNALTVDTHSDTPMNMLRSGFDIGRKQTTGQVDLPRMKEGGLDAMIFAAFVGQRPRTEENYIKAYQTAHDMIDTIHAQVNRNGHLAEIALTAADAQSISNSGKRAIYIGIENGFPLGKEISRVAEFYNKGVRTITLCHSNHNDICDSSSERSAPEHNGVSNFGKEVISEMNRLGMIVDVSHISDKAFYDVLRLSKAPVIASHSSVRAISKSHRNLTDDMIKALAKNGGVIQICLLSAYVIHPETIEANKQKIEEMTNFINSTNNTMTLSEKDEFLSKLLILRDKYPNNMATVSDVVDHIDHVVNLVGVEYVGIGSDFDGGGGVDGCSDVTEFPNITRELLKRGYSPEDINKIWGGNFFRVFREVEKIATTARKI
jgi:membrane dipeptidase